VSEKDLRNSRINLAAIVRRRLISGKSTGQLNLLHLNLPVRGAKV
jgi:hypothetical protein